MPKKMRKMLGDVNSPSCVALRELIDTQSKDTIRKWCLEYAEVEMELLMIAKNETIKMIVTDLDHTLLRHDETVSDYSVSIFKRLRENGVLIAFATARYFRTVEQWLIPSVGIRPDIVISLNGVYAYMNKQEMYKKTITPDIGNVLVADIRKAGGLVTVGTDTMRYCEREIDDTHKSFSVMYDFSKPINEALHYIDVRGINIATAQQIISGYPSVRVQGYADTELFSYQNIDARKELALFAVIQELNISPQEIIGFGDDNNDIEMLKMCGVSVAVENAIDEVKSVADYVCLSNDEDGVARWLDENIDLEER